MGVCARYENEDGHVVQSSQPRYSSGREREKMVEGARGVEGDQAQTEDAEGEELIQPPCARRRCQQHAEPHDREHSSRRVGEPADRFPQRLFRPATFTRHVLCVHPIAYLRG